MAGDGAGGDHERAREVDLAGAARPGKLRLMADTVTSSLVNETPGPALMQAPQLGSISSAPALEQLDVALRLGVARMSCEPNWM
jgi:hypothetical protein